jgi:hypothetical protein
MRKSGSQFPIKNQSKIPSPICLARHFKNFQKELSKKNEKNNQKKRKTVSKFTQKQV